MWEEKEDDDETSNGLGKRGAPVEDWEEKRSGHWAKLEHIP